MRMSKDILELWEFHVSSNINKFGDEKWLVYEQVYISALDCHNLLVAVNCLSALKAQYPKSVRVKKLITMNLEAMGKFEKAEQRYEEILAEDKTNAYLMKRKISCLKSQNKIKEYISELNEYLKNFQADHEAWLELCEAYLNEMEFAKASFCLEELILMNPHNHVYHQKYADIKYTQGNYELARNYYSYSLKLNPNNIRSLYGILLVTANMKSTQKSKEITENSKLNAWAKEQLEAKYKDKKSDQNTVDIVKNLFQYLSVK